MKVFRKCNDEIIETGLKGLIFCDECKFHEEVHLWGKVAHRCGHPSFKKPTVCYVTPIGAEYEKEYIPCVIINRNNDCTLFKPIQPVKKGYHG